MVNTFEFVAAPPHDTTQLARLLDVEWKTIFHHKQATRAQAHTQQVENVSQGLNGRDEFKGVSMYVQIEFFFSQVDIDFVLTHKR